MSASLPGTLIHWIFAGSAAATVGFFSAGLTLYFERGPRPRWVLTLHYCALVLALGQVAGTFFLATRSALWVGVAIAMQVGALLLFLSSIEAAQRTRLQRSFVDFPLPDRLITDGPFAWIRHPFCTGYLLAALAGPVGIAHPIMLVIAVPMIAITLAAAFREERVWLCSARGEEYREYRRKTGMFIPFVG